MNGTVIFVVILTLLLQGFIIYRIIRKNSSPRVVASLDLSGWTQADRNKLERNFNALIASGHLAVGADGTTLPLVTSDELLRAVRALP